MRWPTPELEDWRRTDLGRFDLPSFPEGREVGEVDRTEEAGGELRPRSEEPRGLAGRIRFKSGSCAELSLAERLYSAGARLEPIGMGSASGLLGEALASARDKIALWHFVRLEYGAYLYLPAGLSVEDPIVVDFEEGGDGRHAEPHVAIVLSEGASATVVVRIRETAEARILGNSRVDIRLGQGSALRLFDSRSLGAQSLHFHRARARLAEGSSLERLEAQLGSRLAHTRIECLLEGRGSEATLEGLYFCGRDQHADLGTELRHVSPGATSRAAYKGAVAGGGRAVFQGLIEVAEGASGTDAFLSNRNLLLGGAARADSIPTLRIGNNDVRCSHGSATGRLDEEELFYLQSRGFSRDEARELLILGFFEDLLARAPDDFREESLAHLRRLLADAA
jgi:Fe-S cluster assembly protein SufD